MNAIKPLGYLIDTSVWIEFFAGREVSIDIDSALSRGLVYTSPVIVAEIMSGALSKKQRDQLSRLFRELPFIEISFDLALASGRLRSSLRKMGVSMSTPDALIAQSAISEELELISSETIFQRVSGALPGQLVCAGASM